MGNPPGHRVILCSTGTSVAQGVLWERDESAYRCGIEARLKRLRTEDPDNILRRASAETNSLGRMEARTADRVHLLHSQTPDGKICAEEVKKLLKSSGSLLSVQCHEIRGLQVRDERMFRQTGIKALLTTMDKLSRDERPDDVFINITGGFKSVVPYLTLYGLLRSLEVVYVFERADALIKLPPAPIDFHWERISQARDALVSLMETAVMKKEAFFAKIPGLPYDRRRWYEALLDEDAGEDVTLSAYGDMLVRRWMEDTARTEIMLSPMARAVWESSDGTARKMFNLMLERVREQLFREQHVHTIRGSDLIFYKPGNVSERMGYYVQGDKVFVCELWQQHDRYEREASGCQRVKYQEMEFRVWTLPSTEARPPETVEALHEKLLQDAEATNKSVLDEKMLLDARVEELESEAEAALEQQLEFEQKLEKCAARLATLEAENLWLRTPWWRRLFRGSAGASTNE